MTKPRACPPCGLPLGSGYANAFGIAAEPGGDIEWFCATCGPRELLRRLDEEEERTWQAAASARKAS